MNEEIRDLEKAYIEPVNLGHKHKLHVSSKGAEIRVYCSLCPEWLDFNTMNIREMSVLCIKYAIYDLARRQCGKPVEEVKFK